MSHFVSWHSNEDDYVSFVKDAQNLLGLFFSTVLKTNRYAESYQMPCLHQGKHSTP